MSPEDERSDKVRERIRLYEQSLKEALKQKYEPYKPDPDDPTYLADGFPDHVPYQPVGRFWLQIQSYELETRNIENGIAR